jgi:hypothetical protein
MSSVNEFRPAQTEGRGFSQNVRSAGAPVAVCQRSAGRWLVAQSVEVSSRNLDMVSVSIWWQSPEGHVPDSRRFILIHRHELASLIEALTTLSPNRPQGVPVRTMGLSDSILVMLSEGVTDLCHIARKLYPEDPRGRDKVRAVIAKLRRADLVSPKPALTLTIGGQVRVSILDDPVTQPGGNPDD